MRRYLNFSLVTAAVFLLLATWAAPHMLLWWFASPVPVPINCNAAVTWSAARMIETQAYGLVIGAVAGLVICFWWSRRQAAKAQPIAPPPSSPAAKV